MTTNHPLYSAPRKLSPDDDTGSFDCGQSELNEWLKRYALVSQRASMATVFVATSSHKIGGYYALATGGVEPANSPNRVNRGVPRHPIPVVVLARLAVDITHQGRGLGRALLSDALRRVATAADEIGIRALLIHAKDENARSFYMATAEFEPSPTDPLHLFLLMKDLKKAIRS